jgi:hypothetical protein
MAAVGVPPSEPEQRRLEIGAQRLSIARSDGLFQASGVPSQATDTLLNVFVFFICSDPNDLDALTEDEIVMSQNESGS